MDIHAPNLVSFRYKGPQFELSLECGHQLIEIYCYIFPTTCKSRVSYLVWQFETYLSQLKTFTLVCRPAEVELSSKILPTFSNLTELVLSVETKKASLLPYTLFLKTSPSLSRLEFHFISREPLSFVQLLKEMEGTNWEHVSEYAPHQLLKEVVLTGFRGLPEDMVLSMYLLHNAVKLEKFTIDTSARMLFGSSWERKKYKGIRDARKVAELLLGKKPPRVQMWIL